MTEIRHDLAAGRSIGTNARLVELRVGRIRIEIVQILAGVVTLDVNHRPVDKNPSHSEIMGILGLTEEKKREVAMELCELVEDTHLARVP
jgi:hypothetical protein